MTIRNTTPRALWSGGHVVCPGDAFPRPPAECPEWDAGRMAWERGELGAGVVCVDPPASPSVACEDGRLDDLRKPDLWRLYKAAGLTGLSYRGATEDQLRAELEGVTHGD